MFAKRCSKDLRKDEEINTSTVSGFEAEGNATDPRHLEYKIFSVTANLMETCKAEKYPEIRKTDRSIDSGTQMTFNVVRCRRFLHFLSKFKNDKPAVGTN